MHSASCHQSESKCGMSCLIQGQKEMLSWTVTHTGFMIKLYWTLFCELLRCSQLQIQWNGHRGCIKACTDLKRSLLTAPSLSQPKLHQHLLPPCPWKKWLCDWLSHAVIWFTLACGCILMSAVTCGLEHCKLLQSCSQWDFKYFSTLTQLSYWLWGSFSIQSPHLLNAPLLLFFLSRSKQLSKFVLTLLIGYI